MSDIILLKRFDKFWINYPKKRNKGYAKKVWLRIKPSEKLLKIMMDKIMEAKKTHDWQKDGGQFIPYPSSWLSGECWEDSFETPVKSHISHEEKPVMTRTPRKETKQEKDLVSKMKALTKGINWKNPAEVKEMTSELRKLHKQHDDLRNAPQKLGDLL